MWVSLTQSVTDLNTRQRQSSLEEENVLPADCLRTQTASLPWVSSLPANPANFEYAELPVLCELIAKNNPLSILCTHPLGYAALEKHDSYTV